MKIVIFFILFFSYSFGSMAQDKVYCLDQLKELMESTDNSEQVKKILSLQGQLTLNRLTWAAVRDHDKKEKLKLEKKIDQALENIKDNPDPNFQEAYAAYNKMNLAQKKNNKLSRKGLVMIMPFIQDILNDQNEVEDPEQRRKYIIQSSDIKLLSILAEKEAANNTGLFDHILSTNRSSDRSILNFTKLINSSLRNKEINDEFIKSIKSKLSKLTIEVENEILKLPLSEPCKIILANSCREEDDNFLNDSFMAFLTQMDGFQKDENLRYGDLWLDTRNNTYVDPDSVRDRYRKMEYKVPESEDEIKLSSTEEELIYFNHLIDKVLDRYPYFTSRDDLLKDPELLMSLSHALDNNLDYFIYQGEGEKPKKHLLPPGYNKEDFKKKGENLLAILNPTIYHPGAIPVMTEDMKFKQSQVDILKYLVPKNLQPPNKAANDFLATLIGVNIPVQSQRVFEFRGALYDATSGQLIPATKEALLNYEVLSDEVKGKTPLQYYKNLDTTQKKVAYEAAADNQNSYIHNGKLYYLSNGEVDLDRLVERKGKMSVLDFERKHYELAKKGEDHNGETRLGLYKALIEGDNSIIIQGKVYNPLTLTSYSDKAQDNFLSLFQSSNKVKPSNYVELDQQQRNEWFTALSNNRSTYVFQDKKYSTIDNNPIVDQLETTPDGWVSHTARLELIERLNQLDDRNLIVEYHKNFNSEEQCDFYSIVDKKEQTLNVYSKEGEVLFSKEVLIGKQVSDQRLKFTSYDFKGEKTTNESTSAGIFYGYKFRTSEDHDYYKGYEDCLLAITAESGSGTGARFTQNGQIETVLAVHGTPVNMSYRNPMFYNNNLADNRETNGCINLTQKDCQEYKSRFEDAGCPLYVLPEEKTADGNRANRMKIVEGQLSFIPIDQQKCVNNPRECKLDYYYSPEREAELKEIDIKILNPANAQHEETKKFISTLETEKKDIAKKLNLSDEEYNRLASMAYAILGIESGFGQETRYQIKEGRIPNNIPRFSFTDTIAQRIAQFGIRAKKLHEGRRDCNSRGLTQIKCVWSESIKEKFPEINDNSLTDPRNAAVATMVVLSEMSKELAKDQEKHHNIRPDNREEFLYYIYNGSNSQITNGGGAVAVNIRAREIRRYLDEVHIYEKP